MSVVFENCIMGIVDVVDIVEYQEFDEDMGWEDMAILPGQYTFRIGYIMGWRPVQIFVDDVWIDAPKEIINRIKEVA